MRHTLHPLVNLLLTSFSSLERDLPVPSSFPSSSFVVPPLFFQPVKQKGGNSSYKIFVKTICRYRQQFDALCEVFLHMFFVILVNAFTFYLFSYQMMKCYRNIFLKLKIKKASNVKVHLRI